MGVAHFAVILFAVFHVTFAEDFLYIGAWASLGGGLPAVSELGLNEGLQTFVGIFYDGAVFSPGVILFNMFDTLFSTIQDAIGGAIGAQWLSGLVADGVLGGLFAVLGFLPQILMLFMWFSVLEDTGYMARIAFVLDRIFRRFGLSGRSFMPMIMGFGCSVPAMINTRTLSDENERIATIRVIPFFSCGAKLPILTAIAGGISQYFGVGNAEFYHLRHVPFGRVRSGRFGAVNAAHDHARQYSAVHNGIARIPPSAVQKSNAPPLG